MKSAIVLLSLLAMTAPALAYDLPRPIEPAANGKLQCYSPNKAQKTCQSLTGYSVNGSGMIIATATVLVSSVPLITMQSATKIVIRNSQVCSELKRQDLDDADFFADGKSVGRKQAAAIREQVAASPTSLLGREICTAYVPQGNALITKATDNGVPIKAGQTVIWVSPDEGYRVAP